ncbi:MAG TPA: cellulase family glycosylhydrolase, partial [Drouetiella sp.]
MSIRKRVNRKKAAPSLRQNLRLTTLSCAGMLLAATFGLSLPAFAGGGGMTMQGVNISGGEFNLTTVPGVYNTNYIYPSNSEIDYFASKGLTVIRVPFSWERMQPTANGPIATAELARLDSVVAYAT